MKKTIVTIGRQYGSGGREVGRLLARQMGVPFYDKELIELAAREGGMSTEAFERVDEKPTNSLLYALAMGSSMMESLRFTPQTELPLNDKLFILSGKVIRDLANRGSCVIIGRCADYILRDDPALCSVYVHAGMLKRIDRITKLYDVPLEKAERVISRIDKQRSSYYGYYTGRDWQDLEHYHLCVDSGALGIEGTLSVISAFVTARQEK